MYKYATIKPKVFDDMSTTRFPGTQVKLKGEGDSILEILMIWVKEGKGGSQNNGCLIHVAISSPFILKIRILYYVYRY